MVYIVCYSGDQVMAIGLDMMGFPPARQQRVKRSTQLDDFQAFFGVHPLVIARIWEDLQTTNVQLTPTTTAQILASPPWLTYGMVTIRNFLHAFHFLKRYPTETE